MNIFRSLERALAHGSANIPVPAPVPGPDIEGKYQCVLLGHGSHVPKWRAPLDRHTRDVGIGYRGYDLIIGQLVCTSQEFFHGYPCTVRCMGEMPAMLSLPNPGALELTAG